MAIKVGVASGTWGIGPETVPGQVAWDTFLDESAEAGYEWIEAGHYGYLPTDPDFLRAELAKRGTQVVATTVMNGHLDRAEDWPATEADVLRSGELGASLGAKHMVLIDDLYPVGPGTPVSEANLDGDSWRRLIDTTHRVADIALERFGVPIASHSHAQTHVETQEQLSLRLSFGTPTRVACRFASTPVTTPTPVATRWSSCAGITPGSRTCTSRTWTGLFWRGCAQKGSHCKGPMRWACSARSARG